MSRRTKLLIAALFLVLLAVPAVYAVLTWRPENPLRFRIVKDQGLQKHPLWSGSQVHIFVVEVRNASSVPVELFGTLLYQQTSAARSSRTIIGELEQELLLPPHFTSSGDQSTGQLPPGGAVYLMAGIGEGADIALGEVQVFYTWVSRTKGNCMRWSNGLIGHLPDKLQEHMPRIELNEDESILDVSLLRQQQHPNQTSALPKRES